MPAYDFEQYVGYLEHATRDALELPTANPGKGGYTIFAEMIKASQHRNLQGIPWCATFVHAVINRPDLLGSAHPGTRVLQRRMQRKNLWRDKTYMPSRGDLVFLSNQGTDRVNHCGIVLYTASGTVASVEGNAVDPSGTFRPGDGGAVALRIRMLNDPKIVGYGATGSAL